MTDFDRRFERLVKQYQQKGYDVVVHPTPEQLPDFAKAFVVEIVARRGGQGVLVAARRSRTELAADQQIAGDVDLTNQQPGWRYDLAILGEDPPNPREIRDARELMPPEIDQAFADSARMVALGFFDSAFMTAWGGFEAAMRHRLRAAGSRVGWGSDPETMLGELYSNGMMEADEFRQVEALVAVRNQIVHGYLSSLGSDGESVQFLCDLGHRLIAESQIAALSA